MMIFLSQMALFSASLSTQNKKYAKSNDKNLHFKSLPATQIKNPNL
jgi:hypothetical protein